MIRRTAAVLIASSLAGCTYTAVKTQCPACVVFDRHTPAAPVEGGVRVVFVLVPGLLGFGWEWDEPIVLLRAHPASALQVFEWSPRATLAGATADFVRRTNQLLAALPDSVERVVVLGHSAGGLLTAKGAGALQVPDSVKLKDVDLTVSLESLSFFLAREPYDEPLKK